MMVQGHALKGLLLRDRAYLPGPPSVWTWASVNWCDDRGRFSPVSPAQPCRARGSSCATSGRMFMYLMLAYGFVGFTALLVIWLLWLWALESRDVARRKK